MEGAWRFVAALARRDARALWCSMRYLAVDSDGVAVAVDAVDVAAVADLVDTL